MLRSVPFWGLLVLFGLLYAVLTGYNNPVVTILWGAASGLVIMALLRLSAPDDDQDHIAAGASIAAGGAVVLGTALKAVLMGGASNVWDSAALALAVGAIWAADRVRAFARSGNCFLCKQALDAGSSFSCPRCEKLVCARPSCWSQRHLRCTSCLEREVVLFPVRDEWWTAHFGERVGHGTCDSCYKEAFETDLRACGRCPGLMCRRCWDFQNGECTRCHWRVADLPRSLARLMSPPPGGGRSRPVRASR